MASFIDTSPGNDTFTFSGLTGLADGWYTLGEGGTLPTVSTSPAALYYLDGSGTALIDGTGLDLVDTDGNLSDATIEITADAAGGDALAVQGALPAGITISSSTAT